MAEKTSNEMQNLSLQTNTRSFPRDLLQRFTIPRSSDDPDEDLGSGSSFGEEVELNLGLSLGGRFGVDKSNSKLIRSSSIAAILPVAKDDDVLGGGYENPGPGSGSGPCRGYSGLIRTSSLPVETEEEWRKRKELQSLRRLAAKRRRSEKQRSLTKGELEEYGSGMSRVGLNKLPPGGSTTMVDRVNKGSGVRGGEMSSYLLESSSCSNQSVGVTDREGSSKRDTGKEIGTSCSVEDMPCVFTQGDGPNGRVVEGILYKYGKGEQVKIMCICHGSFLSPAEFVKHAGGTDFLHPLKHIVVKPSSSLS